MSKKKVLKLSYLPNLFEILSPKVIKRFFLSHDNSFS
jgi:hypothetical protein